MTDKVIEELQSASKWFAEHGRNTNTAIVGICDKAVDEINRQRAEIERKDRILDSYALQYGTVADKDVLLKRTKAEAIKEFAEEVKMGFCPECEYATYNIREYIDDLVKEMVGEQG